MGKKVTDNRIPGLDGLRGCAVLMVMTFHFLWFPWQVGARYGVESFSNDFNIISFLFSGWIGVDLFFVLSGFLITGILSDSKGKNLFFSTFYLRRILRIFPLYYLLLLLLPWLLELFPKEFLQFTDPAYRPWLWTYTSNILTALKGWDSVPRPISHTWTLAIEEQYYLIWPFIIFAFNRKKAIYFSITLLFVCLALRFYYVSQNNWLFAYLLTYCRLDSLAAGSLLALLQREYPNNVKIRKCFRAIGLGSCVLLLCLLIARSGFRGEDPPVTTIGLTLFALFFTSVISEVALSPTPHRLLPLLSHPVLCWFGKHSYCLYIIHQPLCIYLLIGFGLVNYVPQLAHDFVVLQILFYFTVPCVLCMALSKLIWHVWELPFLKLRDSKLLTKN